MKISVLQSLIDRTSNQISDYEGALKYCQECMKHPENDFSYEMSDLAAKWYKSKLPKLRWVQKELKREFAHAVRLEKAIRCVSKMRGFMSEIKEEM